MTLVVNDVLYISPSAMSTLTLCERRWWHSYVQGMKDGSTEATATGHGFAAALEFGDYKRGLKDYLEARPQPDGWTDPDADARAIMAATWTIYHAYEGYTARWPDVDVQREVTYLTNIGADRLLQVRVDGVAPTHLIEDKLRSGSSMRAADIENEVRQGRQLTAEVYSHYRKTGELLPVHLRCMKKCDPRKWKTAPLDEVPGIIAAHFEQESSFREFVVTKTDEDMKNLERELRDAVDRVRLLDYEDYPRGLRNTGACHAFGRPCPALHICQGADA